MLLYRGSDECLELLLLPHVVRVVDTAFSHFPFCHEASWYFLASAFLGLLSCQLLFSPTLLQLLPPQPLPAWATSLQSEGFEAARCQ